MHFILCMHHVKFNIFHRAQLFAHTIEHIIVTQLILILMHEPTKLLCVKKYLCTPCAPYYMCAHYARLIQRMNLHIIIFYVAPQFTVHTGTPTFSRSGAKIYNVHEYANIFHGDSVTPILVTLKLLFCEYSLQLNPSGPSKISVELKI
jgi:hypothetical protein